jgi:hypothetical protein
MYGLYCDANNCYIIPSTKYIEKVNINKKCNSYFNRKYIHNNLLYNQKTCSFCSEMFLSKNNTLLQNLIITLECGHTFHLRCFINYIKWKYIDNTENEKDDKNIIDNNIKCSLCRLKTPEFLKIFTTYKDLLNKIDSH